jgi:beta-mannosidase
VKPKALALKKAPIAMDISETANGYAVALSATTLQKDVFIQTDTAGFFENNFIDILPNKPLVIFFRTKDKRRVPEFKLFSINGIR